MISSVIARSTCRSSVIPWKREKSRGSPMRMPMRHGRQNREPTGLARSVPIMATGTTGTPASSAIRATPVRPL
jgi:hypothetical protein